MTTLLEHLCARSEPQWRQYIQHPFVVQLAQGTLPRMSFEHYLKQDYLFLFHFARAFGLAAFKSRTLTELKRANRLLTGIVDIELDLHVQYCEQWGISTEELAPPLCGRPPLIVLRWLAVS